MKKLYFFIVFLVTIGTKVASAQAPVVSAFSPAAGGTGTSVTITGSNFGTTIASNKVFFGATKATITAATATQLTVTVPAGVTFAPVSVTAGTLTGYSRLSFNPTFTSKNTIYASDFDTPVSPGTIINAGTGASPRMAATGDFDGDGLTDLAVVSRTTPLGAVLIYLNNPASPGTFTLFGSLNTTQASPGYLAIGDLDGDGKLDIAVANGAAFTSVFLNLSTGTGNANFTAATTYALAGTPNSIAIADMDGDGKPDLITSAGTKISVLRNTIATAGTSSFEAVVSYTVGTKSYFTLAGDMDGDGKPDLVTIDVGVNPNVVYILQNKATTGTAFTAASFGAPLPFANIGTLTTNLSTIALADMDGDSKLDVIAANYGNNSVSVYRNTSNAAGSFTFDTRFDYATGLTPGYVAVGDLDGDGKPDLVVSDASTGKALSLFHNNFTPGSISSTSLSSRNDIATAVTNVAIATIADVTGDGKPEIMIGAASGTNIYVFKNNPLPTPPVITDIAPLNGKVGSSVTITGTNFGSSAANNIVMFGGSKATITSAIATQIVVTVPAGAAFQPITVINTTVAGKYLSATSLSMFNTTFAAKNSTSEYDLEPRYDIPVTTANATQVVFADVDGDGLADMIVANRDKSFSVYLHNVSFTNYTNAYPATPNYKLAANVIITGTPSFIATGDLDGDGKADIVVGTSSSTSQVFLTTGANAGTATWTPITIVGSNNPNAVAIADIDGDGRMDIITSTVANGSNNSFVCVFLNTSANGTTSFSANNAIPILPQGTATAGGMAIGDIDGDGKPDIVLTNGSRASTITPGLVYILRNVSQPGFVSTTADLSFINPTVAANTTLATPDNPYNVALADVDGDGKLDIAVSTYGNAASVFRNTSTTNLNTGVSTFSFDPRVDFTTGPNGFAVGFGDFDGDGKPDMAVLNGASTPVISVFRNTSTNGATLSSGSFGTKVDYPLGSNITINAVFAISDIDGDGKPDIVSPFPSSTVSMLSILHNGATYAPVITSFTPRIGQAGASVTINGSNFAPIAANNIVYFGSVTATVTAASATQLTVTIPVGANNAPISVTNITTRAQSGLSTLFFNPTFSSKAAITVGDFNAPSDVTTGARSVLIGDMDNDGKPDVVSISAGSILITHQKTASTGNLSAANFDTPISRTATNTNMIMSVLGDIDGDGKLDVIGVGNGANTAAAGTLYIYRNTSVSGTPSLATGIAFATGINPSAVAVADLDGDGRLDIITANFGDGTISIYRNLSISGVVNTSSFSLVRTISVGTNPTSVIAGDLDGDGKPDLVVSNGGSNNVSILRNTSATASINFNAAQSFATGVNPQIASFGDLDGDGKLDIIVPNNGLAGAGNTVSVLRNTSTSGSINMDVSIAPFATGNAPVMAAIGDLNGDGKPDVLIGNATAKTISVLRNTSSGSGMISLAANIDIAVTNAVTGLAVGDLDADGKADIVSGSTAAFSLVRNDPASSPLVTTATGNTTFTSSAATQTPVVIDGALTVTQANRTTLAGATVSITTGLVAAEDVLAFTNDGATMGNITGAYDATTGILTLTSAGSTALLSEFQAALRSVTYSNTNPTPNLSNRTLSFIANDGSQTGPAGTKTIAIVSSNANLASIGVSAGTLSPAFDPATATYTLALANNVSSITITPSAAVGASAIKVNGTTVVSGAATAAISLSTGSNTITIVVTGTDGATTNTYTVTATRAVSANADLSGLSLSSGTLTPAFAAGTITYAASVANNVSTITVTPTIADANSTVKVNGTAVTSGSASGNITLAVGSNTITTVVSAQDGTTQKTYTVTVTRAQSANANLSALTISSGTLSPTFAAATNGYTASVANNITSLTVTPTLADATATIKVNGTAVNSGSASSGVALNVGSNSISIAVTAQNGTTVNTYTISVTRASSVNASLSSLTLSSGTLTPAFASGTLTYGASVANNITSITITPTASDAAASITVNGNATTSGNTSGSIALSVGTNTIPVVVTAQDGITTVSYSVTVTRAASNDAGLTVLSLSSGTLSPAFATSTITYTAGVANSVTAITVTPTLSQANAAIKVNGTTVTNSAASGSIALSVGANIITTVVTAQDGTAQKTYTVTVTRAGSPNANLASLDIDNGNLTPAFSATTTSYVTGVTNTTATVTVTPAVAEPNATIKINGTTVASGTGFVIAVSAGTNTITTVVTAQDGTTKTYTISAIKTALSNNADLSAIALSTGTLSPVFNANTNSYTASVGNSVTAITLTPTTADATAIVKVNGTTVGSGSASGSISLAVGTNTITTIVTAQDNITQNTYTVVVTRSQSSNANLSALALSTGTLSPTFAGATTGYTASVGNSTTAITLTPTITDATASIKVNGTTVSSGSASGSIALSVGTNTINTVITAQDGTTKTYTVAVTRAPSTNANLSALALSSGTLSPTFAGTTTSYTASVNNATTGITLTPTTADATATVKVNGTTVTSGSASGSINLAVGANTITTIVTAQDGTTTNTYTVVVTRAQSSNANLASIALSSGTLSPTFAAATISYTASVTNATTSLTITPTVSDATASVKVNGTAVTSGSASGAISLAVGTNTITTAVTAQDGTVITYTIVVTRAQSSNNNLSNLSISTGTLSPVFASATTAYTVTTSSTSLTVTPTVADATASVKVNGTTVTSGSASASIALTVGDNVISTVVTAQNGATQTYTVTVTRLGTPQTITFPALSTVTYGVSDIAPGATSSNSTIPVTYTSSNIAVATITAGGNIHIVGAGTANITASQAGNATFNAAAPVSQSITVNKATLTITANNQNVTYGSANPTLTLTYTGFVNGETQAALTTPATVSTTATSTPNAGTYPITASGAVSANYSFTYVPGTFTVNQAALTITANNLSKVYGTANPALTLTYTGFVGTENTTRLTTQAAVSTTALANSPVGTYPITPAGATATNYAITFVPGTLTVTPAALSVSVNNAGKTYGAVLPAFTVNYTGFVNGDTQANLTSPATATTTATAASPAGTYPITVSGVVAPNYTVTYTAGVLTVGKAVLTIAANPATTVYGAAIPVFTPVYSGFVNGDTQAIITTAPTLSTTATSASNAGAYPVTASGAVASADYTITYTTATLTINKAPLTITANPQSRPYGVANPTLTVSYSGFVNGDDATKLSTLPTVTTTATITSNAGTYPITASAAAATNYTFSYVPGLLTVGQLKRVLAFNALPNKTFGDADFDPAATVDNGDAVTYTTSDATIATIVAGKVHIVGAGTVNIIASAVANANYIALTPVTQALTINKASQTITFNPLGIQKKGLVINANATSTSGLTVVLSSSDVFVATVYPVTQRLTLLNIGTTTIMATQPGNNNYLPATAVLQTLQVQDPDNPDPVVVHTGVSPNNDGVNDFLIIDGIKDYPNNKLTIADRNGVKLFEKSNYDNSLNVFDGHSSVNGSMIKQGTYFYVLEFTLNGESKKKVGYIILKY